MLRLAELRKEKGLTQRQLAEAFGVSAGNICDYEKGRIEPNINKLVDFADYFEVTLDYLVGRSSDAGEIKINVNLTPLEEAVVQKLRTFDSVKQHRVLGYADALAEK